MRTLYFCPVVSSFYLLLFFLAYSQPSQIGCLPYFHTWCGLSANLGCSVWNVLHAACWKYRTQKIAKSSPSGHHRTTLSGYIFATKARIDNRKNLLNSNISPTRPHNMENFGPLTAEIGLPVWGTPANFNGFHLLAALLHGTLVVGVSQTLRGWTEGTTYIRQGGHHVGHWPIFLVKVYFVTELGDDLQFHKVTTLWVKTVLLRLLIDFNSLCLNWITKFFCCAAIRDVPNEGIKGFILYPQNCQNWT